jgi:glycosyltransferase involved in cell wall biosynthesis
MRIGIDISRIAVAARTGTEQYTSELLAAIARRDRRTEFVLYANARPAALPPLGHNFTLRRIPLPRLWTHARLSAEILAHPPDVLFIPAHVLPLGAPLARHTRSVVTIHDLGYLHFPEAHTRSQLLQLRLTTLWSARVAARVIAISEATRDDLVRHAGVAPGKITVVPHGVAARFAPVPEGPERHARLARYGIGPGARYLLYVGTLQPRKNLARLLDAFAQLARSEPQAADLQLLLAGKRGWLAEPIERQAAALGLGQRVRFLGYVSDDDLPALYSGALTFVLPSLYEGFGIPVLEAMACGAPVLTSATSALREVAGEAALTVEPRSTAAIAAGLGRLVCDGRLRFDLRARGLERAAQFSWERCADATLHVLKCVDNGVTNDEPVL